VCACVKFNCLT